jgi:hypothetical protein
MANQLQEGIRDAVNILMSAHESKLRQQQLDKENQLRRDQFDFQQRQADVANQAADKMFGLKHAELDAQQAQQEYINTGEFQRTGRTPPGMQVVPGMGQTGMPTAINVQPGQQGQQPITSGTGAPASPLVMSGLENSQLIGRGSPMIPGRPDIPGTSTIPAISGGDDIPATPANVYSVPPLASTPEQQLIQQQTRDAQAEKLREFQRTAGFQQDQVATEFANKLKMLGVENQNLKERQVMQQDAAKKLEEYRGGIQLQVARIRSHNQDLDNLDSIDAPGLVHGGAVGGVSQEDVRAKYGSKTASQLNHVAAEQGYQFLPKARVDQMDAIVKMGQIFPAIDRMINLRDNGNINIPGSNDWAEFNALKDNVKAAAPTFATAIPALKRMNKNELDLYIDQMVPSRVPIVTSTAGNVIKRNALADDVQTGFEDLTRGVSQKQKDVMSTYLKSVGVPIGKGISKPPEGSKDTGGGIKGGRVGVKGKLIEWVVDPKSGGLVMQGGGQ